MLTAWLVPIFTPLMAVAEDQRCRADDCAFTFVAPLHWDRKREDAREGCSDPRSGNGKSGSMDKKRRRYTAGQTDWPHHWRLSTRGRIVENDFVEHETLASTD